MLKLTKKEGIENFSIRSSKNSKDPKHIPKKIYYPVLYSEPYNGATNKLGLEISSIDKYKVALKTAAQSGKIVIARIHNNTQQDQDNVMFTILDPVYNNKTKILTTEQREKNIKGFIVGKYKLKGIIENFSEELKLKGIEITILDHTSSRTDENIIYKSFKKAPEFLLSASTSMDIGQRIWTIKFEQTKEYLVANKECHLWYLLVWVFRF